MDDSWTERLTRLERRVERNQRHLELVVTTQREIVDKAFGQVRLALLEQDAGLRSHGAESADQFKELIELYRDLESRVEHLERNDPAA